MDEQTSIALVKEATSQAKELLTTALAKMKETVSSSEGDKLPQFFPDGIHLISINVEVGIVKVDLKVAGAKAPSGLGA